MIAVLEVASSAEGVITIGSSTLLSVSVGTVVVVGGVIAAMVRGYTVLTLTLAAMGKSLAKLEAWHLKATASARDDLDELAAAVERRHHRWRSWQTDVEVRLGHLETRAGVPSARGLDLTPVDAVLSRASRRPPPPAHESTPDPDR